MELNFYGKIWMRVISVCDIKDFKLAYLFKNVKSAYLIKDVKLRMLNQPI